MTDQLNETFWFDVGYREGSDPGKTPVPPTGKLEKLKPGSVAAYMCGWRKAREIDSPRSAEARHDQGEP